jgi:hypothetical protein
MAAENEVPYGRGGRLRDGRRSKPFAAADRRHFEMERRESWMTALIHQRLRPFVGRSNLDELVIPLVRLAEVGAETALTISQMLHGGCLRAWGVGS